MSTSAPISPSFWHTVTPRTLLPLLPPPDNLKLPALPSPARAADFGYGYTLTAHLVPGAYPRSTPYFPVYPPARENETKEERQARVARFTKDLLDLRERHEKGELSGMEKNKNIVWTCLNRYVRRGVERDPKRKSLTLFCAHANGMHKETFEPMLRRLLALDEVSQTHRIDEIWAFDAPQHGDSALINGDRLGRLYDWIDNSRDMLNFFLHYLPETILSTPLPTHLERVSPDVSARRSTGGYSSRQLVPIGHSIGGATLTVAAYHAPALFSGLILLDPVIAPAPPSMNRSPAIHRYVSSSFARRTAWQTAKEAYSLLKSSPFFSGWDDEVLRQYIQYGMTNTDDGGVRLKCTGYSEAYVFADKFVSWEAFSVLPDIDSRISIKWINPPARLSIATHEDVAHARVWRRPTNTSSAVIEKGAHLLVQDSPSEVAAEIHNYLPIFASDTRTARL